MNKGKEENHQDPPMGVINYARKKITKRGFKEFLKLKVYDHRDLGKSIHVTITVIDTITEQSDQTILGVMRMGMEIGIELTKKGWNVLVGRY